MCLGRGAGSGSSDTAIFYDLPLPSVKEFQFQVRAYHWVEFKNISLLSGRKTDVKVVSPDDSAKAEKQTP